MSKKTIKLKKIQSGKRKESIEKIAKDWQKMFPSKKAMTITKIEKRYSFCG